MGCNGRMHSARVRDIERMWPVCCVLCVSGAFLCAATVCYRCFCFLLAFVYEVFFYFSIFFFIGQPHVRLAEMPDDRSIYALHCTCSVQLSYPIETCIIISKFPFLFQFLSFPKCEIAIQWHRQAVQCIHCAVCSER